MATVIWLLVIVFGLFGLLLYKAFRFITTAVGDDSPVNRRVTLTYSAFRYFTRFTPLMATFVGLQAFLLLIILFRNRPDDPLAVFLILVLVLLLLGLSGIALYFDWHYWKVTRGVVLTFDPQLPGLEVYRFGQEISISPQNLIQLEQHGAIGFPEVFAGYGYFVFHLRTGQAVILNNLYFFGHDFLQTYFTNTPRSVIYHRMPWIKSAPILS